MNRYRKIALLTLVALLLCCAAAWAEEAAPPAVGQTIEGFTVVRREFIDIVQAEAVVLEHDRTGAQALLVLNEDVNRTFTITFRTPVQDESGVPHLFEHVTMMGSEKYPSKSLFFGLGYQTYNTYMNAYTYDIMTTYPVASLSEAQLLKYADCYVDSVLHPMVLKDKSLFEAEGWRYVLHAPEDALTVAGTVYTEIQGSYTQASAAHDNAIKTLLPGSTLGNNHGGVPEQILTMTWEDVTAYHQAYYHPSNALACLYGHIEDYQAFLALLNEAFSGYERKDFTHEDAGYTPLQKPVTAVFEYPAALDASTEQTANVIYGFVCADASSEDIHLLKLLSVMLSESGSHYQLMLKDALPAVLASCHLDMSGPDATLQFTADNIDAKDAEKFKQVVDNALAKIVLEGFKAEQIDAMAANMKLSARLITEDGDLGVGLLASINHEWAAFGDPLSYLEHLRAVDSFEQNATDGTLQRAMIKHLIGNPRTALVTTAPAPGLKEQKDKELSDRLEQVKAAMTPEEIAALIEETKRYEQPVKDDSADAVIASLQAVTVDNLPEEIYLYDITDETDSSGVRHLDACCEVSGAGTICLMLDCEGLAMEDMHWMNLYISMLGWLETETRSYEELTHQIRRYLSTSDFRLMAYRADNENGFSLYMQALWTALTEDMAMGYELVEDMLYHTDIGDPDALREHLANEELNTRNGLYDIERTQWMRVTSTAEENYAAMVYATSLEYYDFLYRVMSMLDTDPDAVIARLQGIQAFLDNRTGAIAGYAGAREDMAAHRALADAFFARRDATARVPVRYAFPAAHKAEAMIIGSPVSYNTAYASLESIGLDAFSGKLDAISNVVSDLCLHPLLRDQYGAYGVTHYYDVNGVYFQTMKDPNMKKTFDVIKSLPEALADMVITQETLDGYIMSSYVLYARPEGQLTGAMNALNSYIEGHPQEEKLKWMHDLKTLKVDELPQIIALYERIAQQLCVSSAGGYEAIERDAEQFDHVYNIFHNSMYARGRVDDLSLEDEYFDSVVFCLDSGTMTPLDGRVFGTNEPATMGDLALALYRMCGMDGTPEKALMFFMGYGVIPTRQTVNTRLTRVSMIEILYQFSSAIGMSTEPVGGTLDAFEDANQLSTELADIFLWGLAHDYIRAVTDTALLPQGDVTRGELAHSIMSVYYGE